MKEISVLGIDLAKNVFQLHGNDSNGRAVLKKQLKREKLLSFIANIPPCVIAMEACSSANYWAREFQKLGHTAKLIAPQFVKPFVKSNKNDQADAEAIAEAASRPNMRFVPVKQTWQQDIQCIHRIRQRLVRGRVAAINELHGLLMEYGIALPKSEARFFEELASVLAPESEKLSADVKQTFALLLDELNATDERIERLNKKIVLISKTNEICKRLQTIPGVGPKTATAVLASVADATVFKNGRQFSAWLGLVPRQSSSGGKDLLLGISKRGDVYLRCLLVHGARSVIRTADTKKDRLSQWALEKEKTRGTNRAIVAVANKNARIIWSLMKSGETYKSKAA
jgi:transposase